MRKWLVVIMTVVSIGLIGGMAWLYTSADRKSPEITVDENKSNLYHEDLTEEELLAGVKAVDEVDGDVSETLTVENVFHSEENDKVSVVFVAKDKSNNVTKQVYEMTTDPDEAGDSEEDTDRDEEKKKDKKKNDREEASEEDAFPASGDAEGDNEEPDVTEVPEENLTEEEKAQKREEEKIEKLNPQDPRFYLTTYYLKVNRGTPINQLSYVKDIQDDVDASNDLFRKIQITGTVDVNTPGTYELTYYVVDSNGNSSNGAVLTVVVE